MRIEILTLRFDPERSRFDDAELRALQSRSRVLAFREQMFVLGGVPHLACVVEHEEVGAATERATPSGNGAAPSTAAAPPAELTADERRSFERLRAWRAQTARQEGVPPYVVLTNRQLVELLRAHPTGKSGLERIDGIGAKKIERYGAAILGVLAPAMTKTPEPAVAEATP